MKLREIGKIKMDEEEMYLEINEEYFKGIKGLEDFSHIDVLWWFDRSDNEKSRNVLEINKPYKKSPDVLGVFATRSPERPNPLALSVVEITHIDYANRRIYVAYIDAMEDSIILDLKPYTPSLDRVKEIKVPSWCSHWPDCYESSGDFDWKSEFLF